MVTAQHRLVSIPDAAVGELSRDDGGQHLGNPVRRKGAPPIGVRAIDVPQVCEHLLLVSTAIGRLAIGPITIGHVTVGKGQCRDEVLAGSINLAGPVVVRLSPAEAAQTLPAGGLGAAAAAGAASSPRNRSQRRAICSLNTPMEQPTSSPRANRRSPSSPRHSAYFSAS